MHSIAWWPTLTVLAVATFTDLRSRRIPNWLVLPFMAAGICVSAWTSGLHGLGQSLGGLGLGALLFGVLTFMGGMGMGDVKMMLMAGAFLGLKRTLLTIFTGSVLGSILGIIVIVARRKDSNYELPFGTFLGMAALLVVFFGTPIVYWYQGLLVVR